MMSLVLVAVALLAAGFAVLMVAGNYLVRSSGRIAIRAGLQPVVIGATVVAFGTSMPELMVSVVGAIRGSEGIATGNVVGSNIANILLVLGIAAAIAPMAVHQRIIRFDIPLVIVVTGWSLLVFADGRVSRLEGIASVIALLVVLYAQVRLFREDAPETLPELEGIPLPRDGRPRLSVEVPLAGLSIGGLVAGSTLFVIGATEIAMHFGVSEFAIGATVVAVGTSLPEIATSAVAAWRREHDIAVGNVLGSNLFNILAVLGLTATVRPLGVDRSLFAFELPVMAVATVLLAPLVLRKRTLGRWEGALFLSGFAVFTVVTLIRGT